jgi:hypothetical protein
VVGSVGVCERVAVGLPPGRVADAFGDGLLEGVDVLVGRAVGLGDADGLGGVPAMDCGVGRTSR